MGNPNNCATCDYKEMKGSDHVDGELHCYMFRDEPTEVCMQHTYRKKNLGEFHNALSLILKVAASSKEPTQGNPHETPANNPDSSDDRTAR